MPVEDTARAARNARREERRAQTAAWDTNTAVGAIVLGSLALLILLDRGFRGVKVQL